ncbi:MAG: mercury methylation ferredoxin HgcB [Treponemataceae bacterium]
MEYRYFLSGRSLVLDAEKCIGCGFCREVCPHAVFSMEAGKAVILERGRCMECGACARNCPAAALSVTAGVGCAAAVIGGLFNGGVPTCGCGCGDEKGAKSKSCC